MNRSVWGLALAAAVCLGGSRAQANLIVNGGFETGDFTGWTLSGNTGATFVSGSPHSGTYSAWLGPVGSTGFLTQSQSFATTVGNSYTFDFWLSNDGGTPNSFAAAFNGTTLVSMTNAPQFAYTHYSFDVVATSSTSNISFTYRQDPAYYHLDDVSVVDNGPPGVVVPEPASVSLLGLGAVGMFGYRLRRRKAAEANAAA